MKRWSSVLQHYAIFLGLAGLATYSVIIFTNNAPLPLWPRALLFGLILALCDLVTLRLPWGARFSLTSALILGTLWLFGSALAVNLSVITSLVISQGAALFRRRTDVYSMSFKAGRRMVTAGVAGLAYEYLDLAPWMTTTELSWHRISLSLLVMGLYFILYYASAAKLASGVEGVSFFRALLRQFRESWHSALGTALLSGLVAGSYVLAGVAGLVATVYTIHMVVALMSRLFGRSAPNLEVVKAMVSLVEARDPHTQGHSMRVSEYAAALGEKLGLFPDEIETLRLAGQLHDLGKMGVPEQILQKGSSLSVEEWEVVRQHPVIGADLVGRIPTLEHIAEVIRYHHERYDGKGYPDGLKAEEIPYGARILAVVDAFDAMSSDRPYRTGYELRRCLEELREGKGKQFDPDITEAFIEYIQQDAFIPGITIIEGRGKMHHPSSWSALD